MVTEKLEPSFKNSWKNFWNRGRKGALKETQMALNTLKEKDKKFTFEKSKYNPDLFKEALHNKGLSKKTWDALDDFVKKLETAMEKAATEIPLKKSYSEDKKSYSEDKKSYNEDKKSYNEDKKSYNEDKKSYNENQLKDMFKKISKSEGNLLGEGSYGKVYGGKDDKFVFKVISNEKAFTEDVEGNKAFVNGSESFSENKEFFYRQSNGFVTKYVGSFSENRQNVAVFERVKGEEMSDVIDNFNKELKERQGFLKIYEENLKSAHDDYNKKAFSDGINNVQKKIKEIHLNQTFMLSQMAEGIAAIHESGCINRDIKPKNTMVGVQEIEEPQNVENGKIQMQKVKVPYVKLIDQGLTVDMKSGKKLQETGCAGTPYFIAPETMLEDCTSPACDIFSFGITVLDTTGTSEKVNVIKTLFENGFAVATNSDFDNTKQLETYYKSLGNLIDACYPNKEQDPKQQFLCDLVKKCCSFKPEDRPSAAQVSYCLQVYMSIIGTEAEKSLKFDEVLKMAQDDRPKAIPLALRDMMQSANKQVCRRGCQAVLNLCEVDPSYKNTPSYGLALLRTNRQKFKTWASENQKALQDLSNRIYTGEKPQTKGGVWEEKDIKVSQNEFNTIKNLYKKTPLYGLELLRTNREELQTWASKNKDAFRDLSNRIYVGEKPKSEGSVWEEKDIEVSQDEFNILFPNENVNPKNIA